LANSLFDYVIKSPVDSLISWVDGSSVRHVLSLPIASEGTFTLGPELVRLTTIDCSGQKVTATRAQVGVDPKLKLKFGGIGLPLLGLKLARQWQSQTLTTLEYSRTAYDVPSNGVVAAQTTGTLGYGIVADATSVASYIDTAGNSTDLVQGTFGTFDAAATPLGFAVGANGALKFGQTLWNRSVTITVPLPSTTVKNLSALPYTGLAAKMRVALINLQVIEWVFPSISIDTTGDVAFSGQDSELNLFVNGSYNVNAYGLLNPC
jgi:hypothetical protein